MPANVGEMFYTGETPWHGLGVALAKPATLEEALRVGGLDWKVGTVDLMTADDPPSPVPKRMAIVRLDRPAGHESRVLGVAHREFQPVQNKDGALLFDAIFGQGRPVYHTGGYLGDGEVVWLLASIGEPLEICTDDLIAPYALFSNSHDGSMAFSIRLTTIRVVCQNTLAMATSQRGLGQAFRRAHKGTLREHAQAAQYFFEATIREMGALAGRYTSLTKKMCKKKEFDEILVALLPEPRKPRNMDRNPGLLKAWENRVADIMQARRKITDLRENGQGAQLEGSRGTFWGVLNAVLEFVDHHKEVKGARISYALMGDGMELKVRAFRMIQEHAAKAA